MLSKLPTSQWVQVGMTLVFHSFPTAWSANVAVVVVLQEKHAEEQTGSHGQEKI